METAACGLLKFQLIFIHLEHYPFFRTLIEMRFHATLRTLTSPEYSMRTVAINRQPVELFKILKFEGLVATGGEAKLVIAAGQVSVNGAVETRKRRKIVDGDIIVFADETLQIHLA